MGFLDMLLGGHHRESQHGGHHGRDDHHRSQRSDSHGWGHGGQNVAGCGTGTPAGVNDGRILAGNVGAIACSSCQAPNAGSARFCQQCDTSLIPAKCTQCGTAVPSGSKFCAQCGKACG